MTFARLLIAAALLAGPARAEEPKPGWFGAIDFLTDEAMGGSDGPWDVTRSVGKTSLDLGTVAGPRNGVFVGGGWGYRLQVATPHGMRVGIEMGFGWGRFVNADMAWSDGTGSYFGAQASIGYQFHLGPVILHTATVIGGEEVTANITDTSMARLPGAVQSALSTLPADGSASYGATRTNFVLGQEVGVHVAVEKPMYLWADARYDIDGEWRVRLGVGFATDELGCCARRRSAPAPVENHVEVRVAPQSNANIQINSDGDANVAVHAEPGANVNLSVQAGGDVHLGLDEETQRLMNEAIGPPPTLDQLRDLPPPPP